MIVLSPSFKMISNRIPCCKRVTDAEPDTHHFWQSLKLFNLSCHARTITESCKLPPSFILANGCTLPPSSEGYWQVGNWVIFGFTFFLLLYPTVSTKSPLAGSSEVADSWKGPSTRGSGTNWIWEGGCCLKYCQVLNVCNRSQSVRWDELNK